MKIFILGDSNTFGYSPLGRLPEVSRWPDLLAKALAADEVVVDAENGRQFQSDGSVIDGCDVLAVRLEVEDPDVLVIYLGVNDLSAGRSPEELAETVLAHLKQWTAKTRVIFITPTAEGFWDIGLPAACAQFATLINEALLPNLWVLDSVGLQLEPSDGVHLTASGNRALAGRMAGLLQVLRSDWGL